MANNYDDANLCMNQAIIIIIPCMWNTYRILDFNANSTSSTDIDMNLFKHKVVFTIVPCICWFINILNSKADELVVMFSPIDADAVHLYVDGTVAS